MSGVPPISIALMGFNDEQEERAMRALFFYSKHWQQPWRIASEEEAAQIVLLPADSAEELARWHHWSHKPPRTRLIAYAERTPKNAYWHLTRRPDELRPSPIEFAALLKRIAVRLETHPANEEEQSWQQEEEAESILANEAQTASGNAPHSRQENDQTQRGFLQFFRSLFRGER